MTVTGNAGPDWAAGAGAGDRVATAKPWRRPASHAAQAVDGLLTETGPGFTGEDGTRTFALAEIMVREDLAGRGIAHALYNQLLAARHERRAALLVEPANTAATSTGKWQLHLR